MEDKGLEGPSKDEPLTTQGRDTDGCQRTVSRREDREQTKDKNESTGEKQQKTEGADRRDKE